MAVNVAASVLRSVRRGWHHVDGTMPQGDEDDRRRYTVGTNWHQNSCAADSVILCAIMLDAGRVQIDQISPSRRASLPVPADVLRQLVARPWGLLSQHQRDGLRDVLVDTLAHTNSELFPRHEFQSVNRLLDVGFDQLPQLSWTEITASVCCDGQLAVADTQKTRRVTGFQLMRKAEDSSTQDLTNDILGRTRSPDVTPCSLGVKCTGARFRTRLILDRMPPVLLLHLPQPISEEEEAVWKLLEPVDLTYESSRGQKSIRYTPLGCVLMVNWTHFVVRWKAKREGRDQIIHYDGMVSAQVSEVGSWWAGLGNRKGQKGKKQHTGIVAMFYRQV
jgi:hypothetical protein